MRKLWFLPVLIAAVGASATGLLAQEEDPRAPPLPPHPVRAHDFPNDQGNKVRIVWMSSVDDPAPALPSIPLLSKIDYTSKSPEEQLEYDIDRDRFTWFEYLRRPVAEMLDVEDETLSATFRDYLAGIVAGHLEDPLLLSNTLPDPGDWIASFRDDYGIPETYRPLFDSLVELLADPEELAARAEDVEETYVALVKELAAASAEIARPGTLWEKLETSEALVTTVQTLLDASDLNASRALFLNLYTAHKTREGIAERQARSERALAPEFRAVLDSGEPRQRVVKYEVERADSPDGPWRVIGEKGVGLTTFEDNGGDLEDGHLETGKEYFYRVVALGDGGGRSASEVVKTRPTKQWWHEGRTNNFFWVSIFIALIVGWIWAADRKVSFGGLLVFTAFSLLLGVFAWIENATPVNWATLGCLGAPALAFAVAEIGRRAKELYIRPIAGIQAVEEAIGRATEMGKPILFVPGLSTIEDIATLAALNILGPVAEKAAEYDSKIIVPNRDPIVYTIAQEIVKEAYLRAGRPDSFDAGNIYFVTGRQFAFAAAVNGLMLREKPATNFFLGMFWAESLLLAETGSMTGAIQIAGTDAVTQLPFFIVACDYTLIGEELYAAGAYMGRDPKLLGGLKGQDFNKAIYLVALLLFALLFFVLDIGGSRTHTTDWLRDLIEVLFKVKN